MLQAHGALSPWRTIDQQCSADSAEQCSVKRRCAELHINHCVIVGRIARTGPTLSYASNGTPVCSLVLEADETGTGGETFTTYLPVEITGKCAEQTAAEVEAGDEVQVVGKLKYRSSTDAETQGKVSKLIISTWGLNQRIAASTPAVSAN